MKNDRTSARSAVSALAAFFGRNGYVRRHNRARYVAEGYMKYKKGDEVRLSANTNAERRQIVKLLRIAGFKPGRHHRKRPHAGQFSIPIYGREQVARFLHMIEHKA